MDAGCKEHGTPATQAWFNTTSRSGRAARRRRQRSDGPCSTGLMSDPGQADNSRESWAWQQGQAQPWEGVFMRVRHLFTAVMTVLAVSPAYALGSHQIGVQAGLSVPTGDFSDAANAGYNVGAEYRYVLDRFGVGAEAKYNAWNGSKDVNAAAEALYGS